LDKAYLKSNYPVQEPVLVEAWKGIFEIEEERETIEAALKLGLGYKTNQDFRTVALAQ